MIVVSSAVLYQGAGLLIQGRSGVGKSSLALRLIEQGGMLVSDDQTCLTAQGGQLYASAPANIKGLLEVRGIGVTSGWPTPIDPVPITGVILLTDKEPERMPFQNTKQIEGIDLPCFSLRCFDFALTNKVNVVIKLLSKQIGLIND